MKTGVNATTIGAIERGEYIGNFVTIEKLFRGFDLEIEALPLEENV